MFLKGIYLDQHSLGGHLHAYKPDVSGMFIKPNGIIDIYLINSGCTEAVVTDSGVVLYSFWWPPTLVQTEQVFSFSVVPSKLKFVICVQGILFGLNKHNIFLIFGQMTITCDADLSQHVSFSMKCSTSWRWSLWFLSDCCCNLSSMLIHL